MHINSTVLPFMDLAKIWLLPPPSSCQLPWNIPWHNLINCPIPDQQRFLPTCLSCPTLLSLPQGQNGTARSWVKTWESMFKTVEALWFISVLIKIIPVSFSSCSKQKSALHSILWMKSELPMFVCYIDQDWQITSTPKEREAFLSLIHFLCIMKILWHLRHKSFCQCWTCHL